MVGIMGRLGIAAALAWCAGCALAAEPEEAAEAARVMAVGAELVALVEGESSHLERELEALSAHETNPLVLAWIASIRIHRAKRGEELAAVRNGFVWATRSDAMAAPAASDIDRLVAERLLSLAVTRPREVLLYSLGAPLDQRVVDRLSERGPRWVLRLALGDPDARVRRAAAALMPLVEADEGLMLSLYIDALQPPLIDDWDARIPWENGPLFVPGMPLTDDERAALERSLTAWVRWGEAHGRADARDPARNALWQVAPRTARRWR